MGINVNDGRCRLKSAKRMHKLLKTSTSLASFINEEEYRRCGLCSWLSQVAEGLAQCSNRLRRRNLGWLDNQATMAHFDTHGSTDREACLIKPITFNLYPGNRNWHLVTPGTAGAVKLVIVIALADLKLTGRKRFYLGRAGLWRYSRFSHD